MQSNENTGNDERYFYQVCVVAKLCLIPILTAKEVKHKKNFLNRILLIQYTQHFNTHAQL